jgi:hypothetical protein
MGAFLFLGCVFVPFAPINRVQNQQLSLTQPYFKKYGKDNEKGHPIKDAQTY